MTSKRLDPIQFPVPSRSGVATFEELALPEPEPMDFAAELAELAELRHMVRQMRLDPELVIALSHGVPTLLRPSQPQRRGGVATLEELMLPSAPDAQF